jgi:aldose 1-epimerase
LDTTALTLEIIVKNIGDNTLPYNLGWHPYFCVNDLDNSFLMFNSNQQVVFNDKMISTAIEEATIPNPYALKGKSLDDCFVLEQKDVQFQSDEYKISIKGEPNSTFLQIYAPPGEQRIAIEPMTGISDSFNYKVGLHVLKPEETAKETWTIGFKN